MVRRTRKFIKRNKTNFLAVFSALSLVLNLSFPIVVYAEGTTSTSTTTTDTSTTSNNNTEAVSSDDQSTSDQSSGENTAEDTIIEEDQTSEELPADDQTVDENFQTSTEDETKVDEQTPVEVETDGILDTSGTVDTSPTADTTEEVTTDAVTEDGTTDTLGDTTEGDSQETTSEEQPAADQEEVTGTECLSDGAEITSSKDSDWEVNSDVAETKDDVKLGVRYEFPLNHDVTVTFNCLPKDESQRTHIKIEQISIDELNLPDSYQTNAEYAYDITTGMDNGDFEYDITLPNWGDDNAEIAYVEKSADDVKKDGVKEDDIKNIDNEEKDGSKVKADNLDHFTVFIPISGSTGQPAIDLDHCANGTVASPTQCIDGAWGDGDLVASKAHYFEGDSVPYRAVFKKLVAGQTYSMIIEWDTTKGGKHAIDYLTTFNRTETNADPCSDIYSNCGDGPANSYPIPADLFMQSDSNWTGSQVPGEFKIYNGTITSLSGYNTPANYDDDTSTSITVNFTADQNDWVVIAWGGHISTRENWGQANSAINISGSPYHMRFDDFTCNAPRVNCNTGQQDHQLAAAAVIFPATVTIVKEAVPESSQQFNFTGDFGDFSLVDDGTTSNTTTFSDILNFGSYAVLEAVPVGWSLDSISCEDPTQDSGPSAAAANTADIELDEGENVTCTFNNSQDEAYLTVKKIVKNDNGGTLQVSDFPLFYDQTQVTSGDVNTVSPGTYTVSETNKSGYSASFSGDCDSNGSVTLAKGESRTCTITNADIAPHLTLVREVPNDNGGQANPEDWTLFATDGGSSFNGSSGVKAQVKAGDVITLSESVLPGGYTNEGWVCDGGTQDGNTITLGLDEDVTCTVTNNDKAPTLTLIKNVIENDGGTAGVNDFGLKIDSSYVDSGEEVEVDSNTPVTIDEDGLFGYQFVDITGEGCPAELGGTITLNPGQHATCTITNDDIAPKLTVTKRVVNDNGGTKGVSDFNLYVDQFQVVSGEQNNFPAGTYTVSEDEDSGYDSLIGGACDTNGQVTLNVGDVKECTITNSDLPAKLTVFKFVDNGDGGKLTPADFTIDVTGNNPNPSSFPGDNQGTNVILNAGAYNVTEQEIDGYTPNYSDDCTGTINNGEHKTCTITNDDQAPTLTLVKYVVNDSGGGRQVSDFNLYVDSTQVTSGSSTTLESNKQYTVHEDNLPGYEAGVWEGGCNRDGTITLQPGQDATCTITNNDIAPQLKLVKDVNNQYGGQASAGDWTLGATASCPPQDTDPACGFEYAGDADTFYTIEANRAYALYEINGPDNYSAGDWECNGGILNGNLLVVSLNKEITCTITNSDTPAKLTVTKVVASGDAQVADFNLYANSTSFTSGETKELNAGDYNVYETYDSNSLGDYTGVYSEDCDAQGNVSLDIGDDKICTITNSRDTGTIKVIKNVDWDESGKFDDNKNDVTNSPDWLWNITNGEQSISTGDERTLPTGNYNLTETLKDNYHLVGWSCSTEQSGIINSVNLTLNKDQTITCTLVNAPDKGTISGYKINDLNGNGVLEQGEPPYYSWPITLYDDQDNVVATTQTDLNGYYEFTNLIPGTYYVEEDQITGYVQTVPGPNQEIGPLTVNPGDKLTDNNFGNFQLVTISGYKYNDLNANGQRDEGEPGLPNWTINISGSKTDNVLTDSEGYFEFANLGPGTYTIDETQKEGWLQTDGTGGYTIVPQSGEELPSYLFGNAELTDIHGYKWLDLNGNGFWDCFSPETTREIDSVQPECEDLLSGWTIFIDENGNQQLDEGEQSMVTDDGEHYGRYWFEDLLPGTYTICEVPQDGWLQTYPFEGQCHEVTVPGPCPIIDGEYDNLQYQTENAVVRCEYDFGNQPVNPELTISKFNNTGGSDKQVGDSVLYTITVHVEGGNVYNVQVIDLLPDGFIYRGGSWTASSDVRGNLKGLGITTEPTYHSPGTWQLGDMVTGETVTLTYLADIQNSVDQGLYKDLAWAQGLNILEDDVTASAINPGYVNDTFVGTDVNVIAPEEITDEGEVKENTIVEEVLGASTSLPATGSDTGMLYSGILILLIGLISLLSGLHMLGKEKSLAYLKKSFRISAVALFLFLAASGTAHAGSLAVRMEDPEPSANSSFNITFVALDTQDRAVSVQCFVKKPGSGSFTTFGPTINLPNGGDTDECQVGSSVLTTEGTYHFMVTAQAGSETEDSQIVDVDYDGQGPERPKYIDVNKTGSCTYDLTVKTHPDGDTSYIEIYADDDKNIEVNDGSRIKTISAGPDEKVETDYEVYGSDCNKTFYFATRAFDAAGNPSDVRTQEIETTKTKTVKTTTTEGQPVGAIPIEGGSQSSTTGEEGTAQEQGGETQDNGQVLGGETTNEFENQETENTGLLSRLGSFVGRYFFWLVGLILLLLLGNAIRKRRNQS